MKKVEVVYSRNGIIVINKPSGMAVHSGAGYNRKTVVDIFKKYQPVHRIDKDTSGVLVLADKKTAPLIQRIFKEGKVFKEYIAIVKGKAKKSGVVKIPLWEYRTPSGLTKMLPNDKKGISAETVYDKCGEFELDGEAVSKVKVVLKTGRKHQIRAHFSAVGLPVVNDRVYGDFKFNRWFAKKTGIKRMLLHSRCIKFVSPFGYEVEVEVEEPEEFKVENFGFRMVENTG